MKTMKFKIAGSGDYVMAQPHATPSPEITAVIEIPDDVSVHEVIRLLSGTANVTWLTAGKDGSPNLDGGRFILRFEELGLGKMIRV
jgi:hypothetical protein